ncbi:ABC transporter permease [Falsochrobactrum shanghaiense]|uniref:ABC transporter permease n=1 Tax=Falsochrobactrum shanghaiense TaxID=2201899 RepID=A0A316JQS6_9HYPH|nr:ABC transporter permease [Falsochrobactrum shanghaiense]PWL17590.1 ABC transporter permease [Falsochrobactrum shanghaiense]
MIRFILFRTARTVFTILTVMTLTFVMLRLTGDPAAQLLPDNATEEVIAAFRAQWGLDRPIAVQYMHYLANLLTGDGGISIANGRPAITVASERIPATLLLTGTAFVLMLLIGLPVGIIAALRRGSLLDQSLMTVSTIGYSIPNFVFGIGLVYLLAVSFRLLPSSGSATWAHMILPVATLGLSGTAVLARFTRSAVLDVLHEPYIRAALASGETPRETILRHVLPNAAIPIITIMGFLVGGLVGGSIIVEQVFAWPGIGRLLVDTVGQRDFTVVQTLVMIFTIAITMANLAVDMIYGFLNPRIRTGGLG